MIKNFISIVLFACCGFASGQSHRIFTVDVTYDSLGRVASITHPMTGRVQTYTYNHARGQETVRYGAELVVSQTTYNASGLPTEIRLSANGDVGEGVVHRTYDPLNRLTSQRITIGGVDRYVAQNYSYDDWGFLASEQRNDAGLSDTIHYGYGSRAELRSFSLDSGPAINYGYDQNGNLTSRTELRGMGLELPPMTAVYDLSNNQNQQWVYDYVGRLTRDDRYEYTYNDLDRIETITSLATGSLISHYLYDGNGERIREVSEDRVIYYIRLPTGQIISREIWETRSDGAYVVLYEDYIYHNGKVILSILHKNGQELSRTWQYGDRMGNSAFTVHRDGTGVNYDYFFYAPYGSQVDLQSGEGPHHQYTGHERDKTTGLDYMHARYYDSGLGRFNRPDPKFAFNLQAPYSFNMYAYTQANPINAWDPTGEVVETLWDAFSLGTGIISFSENVSKGNYWSAVIDGVGIAADTVAMAIPVLPGGAGVAIKGMRKGAQEAAELIIKKGLKGGEWIAVSRGMPARALAYQKKITKSALEFKYNGVVFDGFDKAAGVFLETKGPGYADKIGKAWFTGFESMVEQAKRQEKAAGGIPVQWHFAEKEAADYARVLFSKNEIKADVFFTP